MKGTSKVIMGATLVMVVSLAVVLGLILVLLAELYCSLLLRRRQLRNSPSAAVPAATLAAAAPTRTNASPSSQTSNSQQNPPPPPPSTFTSIYAQGVLQAPRSFLFPLVSCKEDVAAKAKKQLHHHHHHVVQIQTQDSIIVSPRQIGLLTASSSSSSPPKPIHQEMQDSLQELVYISNPIYENEESKASDGEEEENTPFETPHTSPSYLAGSGSSGEDDEVAVAAPAATSSSSTPPLSPMKKLPAEASSVSLRDATSLGTSGSDSHSNNGLSSSSSGTPCTSPSW